MSNPARIAAALLALAGACDGAARPQPPDPIAGEDGRARAPVTARGVELRVPQPGGELVVRADALTLAADGSALLEGDVALRAAGGARIEASAERLVLSRNGEVAELEGRVRAALDPGRDGGADAAGGW